MEKTDFKTVDEYISSFSEEDLSNLEKIRQSIKQAVPEAEEVLSWQMPGFKLNHTFVNYAAFNNHYSLFVKNASKVPDTFKKELEPYDVNKGTIHFKKSEPIPVDLISKIAKRAAEETLSRD